MAPSPGDPTDAAADLRVRMRTDLTAAMKARQPQVVAALRSALAALDNAEAIAATPSSSLVGTHIAGAESGVGATEAARRVLTWAELQAILAAQIEEYTEAADYYDGSGQPDSATELRTRVAALAPYRDET